MPDRIIFDARDLQEIGVGVAATCSNDASTLPAGIFENMTRMAAERDFPFPSLHDEDQSIARAWDAGSASKTVRALAAASAPTSEQVPIHSSLPHVPEAKAPSSANRVGVHAHSAAPATKPRSLARRHLRTRGPRRAFGP